MPGIVKSYLDTFRTLDEDWLMPIIDEIAPVLAKYDGFTDGKLDFIINYDIKYRMGADGGEEDAE